MIEELEKVADNVVNNDIYIGTADVGKVKKTNIYGYIYFPKLVLFHLGAKVGEYGGEREADQMVSWIAKKTHRTFKQPCSKIRELHSKKQILVMFFGHPSDEAFFLQRELAYRYQNETHVDFIHNFDYRCALAHRVMGVQYPSITVHNPDTGSGVKLATNKTMDHALFKNITTKTYFRSEEAPTSSDSAIKYVVASTFKRIVMDKKKDVFVVFYRLDPQSELMADDYDNLALEYANHTDLVISEVDINLNHIPGYIFAETPTLMWFPKDDKSGIEYTGAREYASL